MEGRQLKWEFSKCFNLNAHKDFLVVEFSLFISIDWFPESLWCAVWLVSLSVTDLISCIAPPPRRAWPDLTRACPSAHTACRPGAPPTRRRTRGRGWCRRSSGSDLPRSKLSSAAGCFGWLDNYCCFDKTFSRLLFGELEVRWWDVRSCWLKTLHWQARSTDWRVRTWPRGDWETNWRCGRQNSEVTLGAARDTRPGSRTDQLVRELYRQEICLPALYGLYGAL